MRPILGIPLTHLLISTAGFVVFSLGVLWATHYDIQTFRASQERLIGNEVSSSALAIEQLIDTRQRQINVFAREKRELIQALAQDPLNDELLNEVTTSLKRWFPTYFTFTLTDRDGHDLIADIEGFVGEVCLRSIESFIEKGAELAPGSAHYYEPEIHPQSFNYHYDMMAQWFRPDGTVGGVFFVSFYPDAIRQLLWSYESPDHRLFLLNRDRENLIEVTPLGARDKIAEHRDISLTAQEVANVTSRRIVEVSRWEVAGLPAPGLFEAFERGRWIVASLLVLGFAIASVGALFAIGITERARQRAQRATERANEALATEIAIKDRFFSIIGHDLKSPFTSLLGLSNVMVQMSENLTKEQVVDYAMKINVSGKRVFELLDNLLEWARFQMEKGHVEIGEVVIDDIIEKNVEVFTDPARAKDVALEFAPSGQIAAADPNMILLVVRNLVANAIKFTPHGGTVTLAAREDGDFVEVSVHDTGTGIDAEIVGKLFAVDQKTTTLGTDGEVGTGLGLPLCKEMIEANGGRIWVKSALGEGTTFFFTLPRVASRTRD